MYEYYCKIRDERGYKDATVAKGTGIGHSTFSDWKNGRSSPKEDKLERIAKFLDVSVEYLRTGVSPSEYISNDENTLLELFRKLNPSAQEKLIDYADMLARLPENQKGQKSLGSNVG